MLPLLRATALVVAALLLLVGIATAQAPAKPPKEIRLSESHIESFVRVHTEKELGNLVQELVFGSGKSDPDMLARLDRAAQKQGFKDYAEYIDVLHSIGLVMGRIDPQTKTLIDHEATIKKEMADVTADKSIGTREKKRKLKEFNVALKGLQKIGEPSNIDLVMKNYERIEPVF
jgi:hypothetical protein